MPPAPPYNEKELLQLIATGHQPSFSRLVQYWWQPVLFQAMTYLKSPQAAEEAAIDIFEKIWEKRAQLSTVENFKNWLYIVSRNELISRTRRKIAEAAELTDMQALEDIRFPGKNLEIKDLAMIIDAGLQKLTPQQKEAFHLSRHEGLTHVEIAVRMGLSRETVKGHIVNALNFMRKFLRDHGGLLTAAGVIIPLM